MSKLVSRNQPLFSCGPLAKEDRIPLRNKGVGYTKPSEDFERCPGNSPFCLGMMDYNCCGTRPIQDDREDNILSQSDNADDSEDFETVTAKKQKLSLHLSNERKKVLSPNWQ